MTTTLIHGIPVSFPYPMYPQQTAYIENLLQALLTQRNALLESPTGTGKTLCLLCGTLAWQRAAAEGRVSLPCPPPLTSSQKQQVEKAKPPDAWSSLEASVSSQEAKGNTQETENTQYYERSRMRGSQSKSDQSDKVRIPTIFYASRTHAQLTQVIHELKKTCYVSKLRVTLMASRDHLCIHPQLTHMRGAALNAACHNKLKIHVSCHFEGGLSRLKPEHFETPRDIEEMREFGKELIFCPYFGGRDAHVFSHLVLLPYDYLFSYGMRKQMNLNLKNGVVIFDEGHNIEKVAEEYGSFDLRLSELKVTLSAIERWRQHLQAFSKTAEKGTEFGPREVAEKLEVPLSKLSHVMLETPLDPPSEEFAGSHRDYPAAKLLEVLRFCKLDRQNQSVIDSMLSKCAEFVTSEGAPTNQPLSVIATKLHDGAKLTAESMQAAFEAKSITNVAEALALCFSPLVEAHQRWFRLYLHEKTEERAAEFEGAGAKRSKAPRRFSNVTTVSQEDRVLSFWCFNPGSIIFEAVARERPCSIIVTSGTLSPLQSYAQTLGGFDIIQFPVCFSNSHVIKESQLLLKILRSHENRPLKFNYQTRQQTAMIETAGKAVSQIASKVPGGVLIFFPSYQQLSSILATWEGLPDWQLLKQVKAFFAESGGQSSEEFETMLATFKRRSLEIKRVQTGSGTIAFTGAVLCAVFRGRISEGLNFSGDACRCVVVIGVPHPTLTDQKVQQKQRVLNEAFPGENRGRKWYFEQASRAVNQAIGRVIRDINDYGVIVLVDERFGFSNQIDQLSAWLKPCASRFEEPFAMTISTIEKFFNKMAPPDSVKEQLHSDILTDIDSFIGSGAKAKKEVEEKESFKPVFANSNNGGSKKKYSLAPKEMSRLKHRTSDLITRKKISNDAQLSLLSFSQFIKKKKKEKPIDISLGLDELDLRTAEDLQTEASSQEVPQQENLSKRLKTTDLDLITCGVCREDRRTPDFSQSLKCSHVACRDCWDKILKAKFECPFCRAKTRREHLQMIKTPLTAPTLQ